MGEIGVRAVFENFMYTFAGHNYIQREGGPIGARVTMCAARIVMHAWSESYKSMLILAKVEIWLLRFYVDDFRQATSCLKMGVRVDIDKKKFCYKEEWEVEDKREGQAGAELNIISVRDIQEI